VLLRSGRVLCAERSTPAFLEAYRDIAFFIVRYPRSLVIRVYPGWISTYSDTRWLPW